MARLAPSNLEIPSAKTARRRLENLVRKQQDSILQRLPPNAKLSIALDCWTSPFAQAFLAITGYFIDNEWNYREVLLGFEPIHGPHTGANLSEVLLKLLQHHQITERILSITTDNASNNNTLMTHLLDSIRLSELGDQATIVHVLCIAHVIQLSLKQLLGELKAEPRNEKVQREWLEPRAQSSRCLQNREIINTLNKASN